MKPLWSGSWDIHPTGYRLTTELFRGLNWSRPLNCCEAQKSKQFESLPGRPREANQAEALQIGPGATTSHSAPLPPGRHHAEQKDSPAGRPRRAWRQGLPSYGKQKACLSPIKQTTERVGGHSSYRKTDLDQPAESSKQPIETRSKHH